MRSVAKDAGVSLGCVQYYFATKPELEEGVFKRALGMYESAISSVAGSGEDFETFLRRGFELSFQLAAENPDLVKLMARKAIDFPDQQTLPGEDGLNAIVHRRVARAVEDGTLRAVDPQLVLLLVGLIMNGWNTFRAHIAPQIRGIDEAQLDTRLADFMTDVVLNGLRGPKG